MIRPWNPVLPVSPFEALRIADYGDIDISPVSIERTNQIVEEEIGAILGPGACPCRSAATTRSRSRSSARSPAGMGRWRSSTDRTPTPGTSTSARSTSTGRCSAAWWKSG